MIVLELLYLLVFVGCLLISFAWLFLSKRKPQDQPSTHHSTQNISTILVSSHQEQNDANSEIVKMAPESQIPLEQQKDETQQNELLSNKQGQEPQQQIEVLINQCQPPEKIEQPLPLMPLTLGQPSQLSNNIPQITQISSFLQGQSSIVMQNEPNQISQCQRIEQAVEGKHGEQFLRSDQEAEHHQVEYKEERNDWQDIEQRKASRRKKEKIRLLAVKQHYKNIIKELKAKLEQVCIRNNQSFSLTNPNQTITFSEEDSLIYDQNDDNRYFLEAKVEEITNLKEELQFHEEMVTALLEEDMELKEKLKSLEEQNQKLKQSVYTATAYRQPQVVPKKSEFLQIRPQSDEILNKSHEIFVDKQSPHNKSFELPRSQNLKPEEQARDPLSVFKQKVSSPIRNLYASQILFPFKDPANLFASRIGENTAMISTISMMSLVEGAINVGLLGQCRFLNQISKKFTINEIKKYLKHRIADSELIFSSSDPNQNQKSFISSIKGRVNLLIIIKLAGGKCLNFFVQRTVDSESEQLSADNEARLMIMDLSRRKTVVCCQGHCLIRRQGLVWGNCELMIKDGQPLSISSEGTGKILESKEKAFQLLESNGLQNSVEFLQIFALYPDQ